MKRIFIIILLLILSMPYPTRPSLGSDLTSRFSMYNPWTWNWKSYQPYLGALAGGGLGSLSGYLGARRFAHYIPQQYYIPAVLAATGAGLLGYGGAGLGAWYGRQQNKASSIESFSSQNTKDIAENILTLATYIYNLRIRSGKLEAIGTFKALHELVKQNNHQEMLKKIFDQAQSQIKNIIKLSKQNNPDSTELKRSVNMFLAFAFHLLNQTTITEENIPLIKILLEKLNSLLKTKIVLNDIDNNEGINAAKTALREQILQEYGALSILREDKQQPTDHNQNG